MLMDNNYSLSPQDFLAQRDADAPVIDVRTPAEYAEGHLDGAENIDVMSPDFADHVDGLDRDATYYVYCRSGNRSGQARQRMQAMGFKAVHNIGGYEPLVAAGAENSR